MCLRPFVLVVLSILRKQALPTAAIDWDEGHATCSDNVNLVGDLLPGVLVGCMEAFRTRTYEGQSRCGMVVI